MAQNGNGLVTITTENSESSGNRGPIPAPDLTNGVPRGNDKQPRQEKPQGEERPTENQGGPGGIHGGNQGGNQTARRRW